MKIPSSLRIALLFWGGTTLAQTPRATARLSHATVFANRAELTSDLRVALEPGTTELLIDGIATALDPQSIQLTGRGDVVILGVSFSPDFLQNEAKSRPVQLLDDSLRVTRAELARLAADRDVVQQEKDLLIANRQVGGSQTGVTIEKLQQMAAFFRRQMTDLNAELLRADEQQTRLRERAERLQKQRDQYTARPPQPSGQLRVSLQTKTRTTADLSLRYVAFNAGWVPTYDVRSAGRGPVQLLYKASVSQQTGLDWNDIRLTLSSANPALGGQKPELGPQLLDFYQPRPLAMSVMRPESRAKMADIPAGGAADMAMSAAPAPMVGSSADYTQVSESTLALRFDIALPYSVPSGGAAKVVDIQRAEVPARYRHAAVPKLEEAAFLQAELSDWEKLNLLPGRANVFLEGTFVGESYLNPQTDDTLRLSLGRDANVLVKREAIQNQAGKKGSGERETRAYRITVRNTRSETVNLSVEDQVPVSRNSQITVEDVSAPGASRNAETGTLTYSLSLKPAETRTLDFGYTVRHPKNRRVIF